MRFSKDAAHFLQAGVCKGSEAEIQMLLQGRKRRRADGDDDDDDSDNEGDDQSEMEMRARITSPRYIIYDFARDTSGAVHIPNLCVV